MNFYPIYRNKKLLPWIKWWILKGNKVAPKHLSEWINSAEAITLTGVYKGSPLLNLNLKGNTSQTGTPTPEAPVPVNVVKGNNTIKINDTDYQVNLKSKNLVDIEKITTKVEARNGTVDSSWGSYENGVITNNRSFGQNGARIFSGQPISLTNGQSYTLSCECYLAGTNANTGVQLAFCDLLNDNVDIQTNRVFLSGKEIWQKVSFTITSNGDYNSVGIIIEAFNSGNTLQIKNIMINKGSEALPYEPYYDYELCKIGDYQDVIYKENNKWYVDKYIEKIVLNGTETFTSVGDYVGAGRFEIQNYLGKGGSAGNPNCLCNYYNGSFDTNNGSIFVSGVNSRISIINHSFRNNLEGFKTWLAENKPIVYYVLPTSETSEITETNLISQLEAIYNAKLQSGNNTITQTPSDLPFYLNFQYYEKG